MEPYEFGYVVGENWFIIAVFLVGIYWGWKLIGRKTDRDEGSSHTTLGE